MILMKYVMMVMLVTIVVVVVVIEMMGIVRVQSNLRLW